MFGKKMMTVEMAEEIARTMNNRDGFISEMVTVAEVMKLKPVAMAKNGGRGHKVYCVQYWDMTVACCIYPDGRARAQFVCW